MGKAGKGLVEGLLHPGKLCRAAVVEAEGRRLQQFLIPSLQALASDGAGALLTAQLVQAISLAPAHLLPQTGEGILKLVVDLAADLADEVLPLAVHIGRQESPLLPCRLQHQLTKQAGGLL